VARLGAVEARRQVDADPASVEAVRPGGCLQGGPMAGGAAAPMLGLGLALALGARRRRRR
jgi:hypothetical protein